MMILFKDKVDYIGWMISAISCFRYFAPKAESEITKKNMTDIRLLHLGRRQDNKKYARRYNVISTGEGTKITSLKFSCPRVEIFRARSLCL